MTLIQIWAVLNLLLAFNVPQAKVNEVEVILLKTAVQSPISAPTQFPSEIGGVGAPEVTRVTAPSVTLKVDGQNSPAVVEANSCITAGVKTCANVPITWVSTGVIDPGCGITGVANWAGNYGTSGGKSGQITGTTTVTIQCFTAGGTIQDSVNVTLK